MTRSLILLGTSALLGLPAAAQEGANMMVPTVPGMFGIDTCGAFLCGSPATVPHGSKRAVHALEAAFRPKPASSRTGLRTGSRSPQSGSPAVLRDESEFPGQDPELDGTWAFFSQRVKSRGTSESSDSGFLVKMPDCW